MSELLRRTEYEKNSLYALEYIQKVKVLQNNISGEKTMKQLKKGSTTIEAMFIMQIVIIVIFIVFRMSIVQYQNVVLSAQAMGIATKVGYYWDSLDNESVKVLDTTQNEEEISAKDWITNSSFMEHNPYQSLVELVFSGEKKEKVEQYVKEMTGKVPSIMGEKNQLGEVIIDRKQGILQNYITVTVTRKSINPLESLFKKIGFYEKDEYTVTAKGIQTDTTEFARTVSMLRDLLTGELVRTKE